LDGFFRQQQPVDKESFAGKTGWAECREIKKDSTLSHQLLDDSAQIEKFARERYLMKKEKEDLFLVIDTTADPRP
jgi:hypothetical protein